MSDAATDRIPFLLTVTAELRERSRLSMTTLAEAVAQARRSAGNSAFTIAWCSDLHLHAPRAYPSLSQVYANEVDTSAMLELALCEVNALSPHVDLLVLGGDLADSGCGGEAPIDEYAELHRLLDAHLPGNLPSLPISGNHDHADAPLSPGWHQAMARQGWPTSVDSDDFYYVTRTSGWRLIALDTRQGQSLSERQRQWLASELASDSVTPTVVLMHRPIVSVGNWVDMYRLRDRATTRLISASPCIQVVLSGHAHRPGSWSYQGKHHLVFPALAYGIPDPCGWGIVVLNERGLQAAFVKQLAVPAYHDNTVQQLRQAKPDWRQLLFPDFTHDMLFNPCELDR